MTADEMFRALTLEGLSIHGLKAEMHQTGDARGVECTAHVEFQLTPSAVEGSSPPQFALQTRLTCAGTPVRGNRARLFDLEIRAVATYRQIASGSLSANDFAIHHTVFARHLFPAMSLRAQALLHDLGMQNIRLPVDLPQQPDPRAEQGPVVLN
jgi:hypothetical protein